MTNLRAAAIVMWAFLVVRLLVAWEAWLLWNGSKAGAVFGLALLLIEVFFWLGSRCRFHGCSAPRP